MIASYLSEAVQLRNSDSTLKRLLREFEVDTKKFFSDATYSFDLADRKPGKYFVSAVTDEDGNEKKILCFTYSKEYPAMQTVKNFIQVNMINKDGLTDGLGSLGTICACRSVGLPIDWNDPEALARASSFMRKFVQKLSRMSNMADIADTVVLYSNTYVGYDWSTGK